MKKVYLLVLLNSLFINLWAQNFDWAKREGKDAYDYGYGVGTDNSGNVYVAGKYEQSGAMFSGTALPCQGNHDIYVAKYNSAGALVWIRTGGGTLGDYAHAMACDKTSAVYIAGEIEGANATIVFPGSPITLTSVSDNDLFVAKYDLNGNLLWAKSAGGNGSDKALGVTYDNAGNVYICGRYTDAVTFNASTTLTPNAVGVQDIFVAKYDTNGNFIWAKSAGGAGRDEALSIKCNAAGEIYVCGLYSDGAVFGSTTLTTPTTSTGHYLNTFLAKYASDGTMMWVKPGGGDYDDVAWSLTLDNAGIVYVAGEFNGYATFDATHALSTAGNADAFVTAYDPSGNVLWATQAGGTLVDRIRGIGTDGSNLYVTGQYGGTAAFGATSHTAVDSSDIFIAGLSNTGNFLWSKVVTGPADSAEYLGYESGDAVTADGPNTIYATGALLNGGTFGVFNFMPYSRTDMFLTKINMLVGINEQQTTGTISLYPNPSDGSFTIDLNDIKAAKTNLKVFNYLGDLIDDRDVKSGSSLNVDISTHVKGIYFVEIKADDKIYKGKVIIQ